MSLLILLFFMVWGACLGSFATALMHRIPRGISWIYEARSDVKTRSACVVCHKPLNWHELIPVLSYLRSHGQCRKCDVAIGRQYIFTEVTCAVLSAGIHIVEPYIAKTFFYTLYIPFAVSAFGILLHHKKISLQLILIMTGLYCVQNLIFS